MRFPNAATGVKKIFTAEIIALIVSIATFVASTLVVVAVILNQGGASDAVTVGLFAGAGFVVIVVGILAIIGAILRIVGIVQASKDEDSFKTAIICLIIGIVGSVIGSFFSKNPTVSSIGSLISQLMSLFVTIFIISGIIKLADKLNDGFVSTKGTNLLKLITVIYALSLIGNLVVLILGGAPNADSVSDGVSAAEVVAAVIYLIATILSVIQYFMYLSYLSNAKKMLAEN